MFTTRRYLLFLFFWLAFIAAHSQHEHWKWKSYGVGDGLAHSEGYCLAEDSMGFIWIGTEEGVSRFDGQFFLNFKVIAGDTTSLVDNRVRYLTVEPGGNILIGTISGFSMFDYATGKFFSHNFDISVKGEEQNNVIRGFQCWPDGHIWVYTRCNVYDWDRNSNTFTQLDKSLKSTLGGWGPVTLPTGDPYKCWVSAPNSLALVDYRTKSMTNIQPTGDVFNPADTEAILESCSRDRHGRIWYNSISHGTFYCYDPATNYQRAFKQDTIEYGRRVPMSTMAIYADRNDRLWVSTWSAPPYLLDTLHQQRRHFQVNKYRMEREPVQIIRMYFQASNGDLWITGNFGLCVHSEAMETVRTTVLPEMEGVILPHDQNLHCVLADSVGGRFFLGAANGIFHYLDDKDEFLFDRYTERSQDGAIYEMIWLQNEILCGTWRGLYTYHPGRRQFKKWNTGNEVLDHAWITAMAISQGELFIGTRTGELYRYNLNDKRTRIYTHKEDNDNSPLRYYYDKIIADKSGNMWLASHNGYSCFDLKTETFTHFRPAKEDWVRYGANIWNMICDLDGNVWVATFSGVFRIDPVSKQPETIVKASSGESQVIFPYFVEEDGTIWFNASRDFFRVSRGSKELRRTIITQPTNNYFEYFQGVILSNKVMLFMSNYELLWYDHEKHKKSVALSRPVVNWISAGDTTIANITDVISLNSDHNYFTFTYSSLSSAAHGNLEFQYKVQGVDEDWVPAQKSSTASYNNLSGGDYQIMVRVRLPGSDWVEMEKPLLVKIAMRYYETTAFKVGLMLILLVMLAVLFYWRRRTEHRIAQERAVASFIELSGELSFDELCKQLVNSFTSDLRYNLAALYLMDDEGNFSLKARQSSKKIDAEFPTIITCGKNETTITAIHKVNRALGHVADTPWEILPVEYDGGLMALIALTAHATPISIKGDKRAVEKLMALFTSVLVNYRAEEEMKKKEEMLAHINALLSESQLVSLRAQMNPHFVFNCLNSIQQSIVMKQYNEASTYLNKFSRLFRMVLNNSSRSLITLEEEINVLTLYLELEHMRFQEKFDYHIEVSDDMDVEEIMIPSMLLQPFVENALWHGLMHKESDRKLDIRFYMRDEEVFICEIEDNGIGRERAAEIKRMKAETKANESKGIKISTDRLNLISMQQGKHAALIFEDKRDASGNASGTLIRFELSAFLN